MRILRSRAAVAVVVGAFVLAGCGGGGSASLPVSITPSVASPTIASPQSLHRKHRRHPLDASVCTTMPVNGLQVTTTSMTLAPNGSSQFTACTQYASTYSITVSPSGVLTAPKNNSSVTPTTQPTTIKTATITVTAGATGCKNAAITIKDKKGNKQTVNVTVTGCSQTFTFTAPGGAQTFAVPSGVTQITVDAVGASGGKGCSGSYTNAGGKGFELKASGIAVTPGQMLYVYVGGGPPAGTGDFASCSSPGNPVVATYSAGGFNGGGNGVPIPNAQSSGGGGGASDVRTDSSDLTTRLIVAGGGGGGAAFGGAGIIATGGDGGYPNGATGGYAFAGSDPTSSLAGQGGTQTSGGPGGQLPNFQNMVDASSGNQGALAIGADANGGRTVGAGGGGYYGGGSAAAYEIQFTGGIGVAGGGGGSSFVMNGATVIVQQVATSGQCDANNNGCVTISW